MTERHDRWEENIWTFHVSCMLSTAGEQRCNRILSCFHFPFRFNFVVRRSYRGPVSPFLFSLHWRRSVDRRVRSCWAFRWCWREVEANSELNNFLNERWWVSLMFNHVFLRIREEFILYFYIYTFNRIKKQKFNSVRKVNTYLIQLRNCQSEQVNSVCF